MPVYFVIKGSDAIDYSDVRIQNMICSTSGCDIDSMLNQINQAALQPAYSKLSIAANSWLDDYFDWLGSSDCCRVYPDNPNKFCPSSSADYERCKPCNVTLVEGYSNRPVRKDFYKYLRYFLVDNPGLNCAKGGHAAYGASLEIIEKPDTDTGFTIGGTYFMGYSSVGLTSTDFIQSLKHANEISANITNTMREKIKKLNNDSSAIESVKVFPYR